MRPRLPEAGYVDLTEADSASVAIAIARRLLRSLIVTRSVENRPGLVRSSSGHVVYLAAYQATSPRRLCQAARLRLLNYPSARGRYGMG